MKLIQQITKPVSEMFADQGSGHSESESTKRKFVVTIKGADGSEVEKNCKAYSITDIKHHFGDKFIDAELHPDEKRFASDDEDEEDDDRTADEMDADEEPSRPMPKQRARNAAEAGRGQSARDVKEGKVDFKAVAANRAKKDFDFQLMMAGAMKRDDFNKKWKLGKYAVPKNKLAGPGGVYKNLLVKLGEAADATEGYGAMVVKFGFQRTKAAGTYRNKDVPGAGTIRISQHGHWTHSDVGTTDATEDFEGTTVSSLERHLKAKGFGGKKITEMAKRTTPAEFYKLAVKKHGEKNAGFMSWAMIKAVADEADILIPAYIRDNKIGRGVWDAKPKDMKAPAHEPSIATKEAPKAEPKAPSKDAVERTTSRMAADAMAKSTPAKKEAPAEPKGAPVPEKKDHYEKHDFDVEFAWTTSWSEPRELYAAIKQHHGVEHSDTERKQVGKSSTGRHGVVLATYYIVKKGTMDVLGQWTVTGADKIPGRGFVSYGSGHIAMSKKAIKNRDDNRYGFLIKPQHGSPYISVGTQHSHGPWDEFSAKANVQDKYQHFEYDDEFGHGTIQVVKVVKKNGKWERA